MTEMLNEQGLDFTSGWIYVLGVGVGVAGGMALAAKRTRS